MIARWPDTAQTYSPILHTGPMSQLRMIEPSRLMSYFEEQIYRCRDE